ncbi:alkaline phosphatase family protein [Actinosynnema sp. NPDC020468]|uniref:alkaline phosphatase family protein n=1 Tax=Actinosynnema sp. NPDC020468 TaxID=3154488 RepID=UPI0034092592
MTVYWFVWDAAAAWFVDELDAEGALPHVRALRSAGVRAAGRPPAPNCQTPPSLATLFTGTSSQEHGVTGFSVPTGLTEHLSGFAPAYPARSPVWREAGVRGAFVHAPWVFDADGRVGPDVEVAIEAYSGRLAGNDTLAIAPGEVREWPVATLPVRVEGTADGALLRAGGAVHPTTTGWTPVRFTRSRGFWVRHVDTPNGRVLVRTGTWTVRTAGSNSALAAALADTPVFAGEGVGPLYRAGLFGRRLAEGGDGSAERAFLESVDRVVESFTAAAELVVEGHDADLVVVYLPWTDDVGHELLGWCDRRAATHRPDIAERVRALLRRCYRSADAVLGHALARAGADDTVLLSADHGMVGSTHLVCVNEVLIAAGLAAADPLASAVVYHPANNGSLRVNPGVVPAWRRADTMRRAMTALLDLGPAVVTGFLGEDARPTTEPADVVYLVLGDDYQPSAARDGGPAVRPMVKTGSHVVNTGSDRLHATFAAAGPGIPSGVDLGVVDNTLAARLARCQLGRGDVPAVLPTTTSFHGATA